MLEFAASDFEWRIQVTMFIFLMTWYCYIQNPLNFNSHNKSGYEQEKKTELWHLGFELHSPKIVETFQS